MPEVVLTFTGAPSWINRSVILPANCSVFMIAAASLERLLSGTDISTTDMVTSQSWGY